MRAPTAHCYPVHCSPVSALQATGTTLGRGCHFRSGRLRSLTPALSSSHFPRFKQMSFKENLILHRPSPQNAKKRTRGNSEGTAAPLGRQASSRGWGGALGQRPCCREVRQPGAVTELALLLLPAAPLRRTHTRAQTRTQHAQAHACAHAQIHIHIYHTHTRVHTHTHRPHTHTCIHCVPHVYTRTHTCILDIQTCAHA